MARSSRRRWGSGLLDERADPQRRRELRAIGQGHLLLGVVGVEAVLRLAPGTRPALTAHSAPVQDDEVARRDIGDTLAHRLDHTSGLMAQQERKLVADATLAVVHVRVADPARLD